LPDKIEALVKEKSGFLVEETARKEIGVSVCYWTDLE